MVSDAREGLQADHPVDTRTGEAGHPRGDVPSLTILVGQVEDLRRVRRLREDGDRGRVAEIVSFDGLHLLDAAVHEAQGNGVEFVLQQAAPHHTVVAVDLGVDEVLHAEIEDRWGDHLHIMRPEPFRRVGLAVAVESDVDLADNPHFGHLAVVNRHQVKVGYRLFQYREQPPAVVCPDGLDAALGVEVEQFFGASFFELAGAVLLNISRASAEA